LGTTTISGVVLLDTKSYIGGRVGYKWILGKKWLVEPSANYVLSWNANTFDFFDEYYLTANTVGRNRNLRATEEIVTSLVRNTFINVRFGYCMF